MRTGLAAGLVGGVLLWTSVVGADDGYKTWPVGDGVITGAAWATFGGLAIFAPRTNPSLRCQNEPCGELGDGARPYNRTWDWGSYAPAALAFGGALVPAFVRSSERNRVEDGANTTLVLAEALGLTFAVTEAVKISVPRYRPFLAFPPDDKDPSRVTADANASFWSGHTASVFAAAAVGSIDACGASSSLGCVVPTISLHALAAATGIMRVLAGKHHLSDVVAGAAAGSAVGTTVALVHRSGRKGAERPAAQAIMGSQGLMLSMMWWW